MRAKCGGEEAIDRSSLKKHLGNRIITRSMTGSDNKTKIRVEIGSPFHLSIWRRCLFASTCRPFGFSPISGFDVLSVPARISGFGSAQVPPAVAWACTCLPAVGRPAGLGLINLPVRVRSLPSPRAARCPRPVCGCHLSRLRLTRTGVRVSSCRVSVAVA